jgi:hypothetical protein
VKQYIVLVNGNPRTTNSDSGIRVYKTRERAEKESKHLHRLYNKVEVGELSIINVRELSAKEGD